MAVHRHELHECPSIWNSYGWFVRQGINDELAPKLSRDGLADQFCRFSGWIVTELIPAIISHDPVVETFVRDYVNGGDRHGPI